MDFDLALACVDPTTRRAETAAWTPARAACKLCGDDGSDAPCCGATLCAKCVVTSAAAGATGELRCPSCNSTVTCAQESRVWPWRPTSSVRRFTGCSRAATGMITISERVRTAIDQLNYVPNFVAGGLASAGSRVVSIVVPSVRNAFFSSTVSQIEAALAQDGLLTLVGNNEYSLEVEESLESGHAGLANHLCPLSGWTRDRA